jgi:hypothetical protein
VRHENDESCSVINYFIEGGRLALIFSNEICKEQAKSENRAIVCEK